MKSLSSVFDRIFNDPSLRPHFVGGVLVSNWAKIVGPQIAEISKPIFFKEGALHVRVESAAWRNQLNMLRFDIIKKANTITGRNDVTQIVFR